MHILSFTVDGVIDQNVPSRCDGKLTSSTFKAVRKHRIVALIFDKKVLNYEFNISYN